MTIWRTYNRRSAIGNCCESPVSIEIPRLVLLVLQDTEIFHFLPLSLGSMMDALYITRHACQLDHHVANSFHMLGI